jgi:hypothetical protein
MPTTSPPRTPSGRARLAPPPSPSPRVRRLHWRYEGDDRRPRARLPPLVQCAVRLRPGPRTAGGIGTVIGETASLRASANPWDLLGYQTAEQAMELFDQGSSAAASSILIPAVKGASPGSNAPLIASRAVPAAIRGPRSLPRSAGPDQASRAVHARLGRAESPDRKGSAKQGDGGGSALERQAPHQREATG